MSEIILATYPAGQKLYQLNGTTWILFPSQPPAVSEGVWGGPNDTIWIHNRRHNGPVVTPKYYRFDGVGTWVEFTSPNSFPDARYYVSCIHGSVDGSIVYAAVATQSFGGAVHKFSSGIWSDLGVSFRAGSIWCDETGQYVWASNGDGSGSFELQYSDDYGATWTSMHAQMMSDLGMNYYAGNGMPCGVWGTDQNNVYMAAGWQGAPPPAAPLPTGHGGCILKWNGSTFEYVSINSGTEFNYYLVSPPWSDGTRHIMHGGYNYSRISRDESGTLVMKKDTGYYDSPRGRGIMATSEGGDIVAIVNGIFGNGAEAIVSTDDGDTWVNTNDVWGGSGEGLQGLTVAGWVKFSAPYLADQSPAPDSIANPPDVTVEAAVRDDQGDLLLDTVRIYVNGTLAWKGGAQLPGFIGDIEAVSDAAGYLFGFTPAAPFEPGVQTIRITAEDNATLTLDETYTFTTVAALAETYDDEQEDQTAGIDLRLDSSHDLVVTDYDLELVAGADEVAQHLLVGLKLFLAEWYLDEDAGIPYYRHVFVSAPNSRVIEGIFRQDILGDEDIEALVDFEMEYSRGARRLALDFRAVSKVGPVDVAAVFP